MIDPLKKVALVTQNFFSYCVPFWKQASGFCPCDYWTCRENWWLQTSGVVWRTENDTRQMKIYKLFCHVYVVVQFYPWFNFIFLCFKLIIIHYHTQKQKRKKFKPGITLNHHNIRYCNTCTTLDCQIREWISEALLMCPNIAKRKPQFTCLIRHCTFECCWLFSTSELKFEEAASAASLFAPGRLFLLVVSFVSCS